MLESLSSTEQLNTKKKRKDTRHTFVFKASWRGTAKFIKLKAKSYEEAEERAYKRKDIQGCMDLTFIEERVV